MVTLLKSIDKIGEKNIFSVYSSFFRLFICFHLLKKVFLSWDFMGLLYKSNSFLPDSPTYLLDLLSINTSLIRSHFEVFIVIYVFVIILFFFGIGKHFTAIILFLLYEILQGMCHMILNGGDNLLKFLILYMILMDSYKYFSINKINYRNSSIRYLSNALSNIGGISICMHICFAYFLSGWHKIHTDVWFNGVATYYTLSLERFRGTTWNSFLAKNGVFVTISTYFTMLVEIYYPVLIWVKKTKKIISISAIMLHLGIYTFMMIYDFQIVFIVTQGFFFSNEQWIKLLNSIKFKISKLGNFLNLKYKNEIRKTKSKSNPICKQV